VAVDAAGDVVATGAVANPTQSSDFVVVKLASASGAVRWRRAVNDSAGSQGAGNAAAVDTAGNVVAGGFVIDGDTFFTVTALEGASGAEIWRDRTAGGAGGLDQALAVAAYGDGRVAAGGAVEHLHQGDDFFVTAVRTQLAGRQLVVQDAADPSKRKLSLTAEDDVAIVGASGGPADPTRTGAELALFNPLTGELSVVALPASKWTGLGDPAGADGYQYADSGQSVGPCRSVALKRGEALKASCSGRGLGFTLNEPAQRALAVALRTGALEHCLYFGGRIVKDVPAAGSRIGEFQATNAPAPWACFDSALSDLAPPRM